MKPFFTPISIKKLRNIVLIELQFSLKYLLYVEYRADDLIAEK